MFHLLAQVVATDWFAPLTQFGMVGAMLYWLTVKVEARLKAMEDGMNKLPTGFQESIRSMEEAVDRMAKAAMVHVLAFKLISSAGLDLQEQAKTIIAEIEDKRRNK